MVSYPSAQPLLKEFPAKLHRRNNIGHKLVHGAGGGLHMLVLLKLLMLMFYLLLLLMLNLQFNSSPKAECNSASGRPRYRGVIVLLYYKQA